MSLSGKVAVVTGGSRGIGRAIVERLAGEGADVAFTYASSAGPAAEVVGVVERQGRRALAIQADSGAPEAVRAAVERSAAAFGRLDIVVNSAGVFPYGPFEEVSLDELDRVLAIHVKAAFVAAQAASVAMKTGGRIISIGTSLVARVPGPGTTLYSASKAALIGLTKGLARELGPRGITVNLVHPGPIDTDMNPADGPAAADQLALLALGHYGKPEDIAATVAHLAGDGGRFITGAEIAVDGGYTV